MRGAETVTIRRSADADWQGDPTGSVTEFAVGNCQLWPRVSSEDAENGRQIVEGWNVFIPPQTVVEIVATDTIVVRGEHMQIVGTPARYDMKSRDKGTIVICSKSGS